MDRPGYIYIIKADTGHYKIGRTKNPKDRMNLFSIKLPFTFEIYRFIQVDDMCKFERWLHLWFADEKTNGEWFNLSPESLALLEQFETQQDIEDFIGWIRECSLYYHQPSIDFFAS